MNGSIKWYVLAGAGLIIAIALFGADKVEDLPGGSIVFGAIHSGLNVGAAGLSAAGDIFAQNNGTSGLLAATNPHDVPGNTPLGYGQRG